jgi:hypothetical protein
MSRRLPVVLLGLLGVAVAQQAAVAQSTPSSTGSRPAASAPMPEVTIEAQRARLEARVGKFVGEITELENGGEGGLAYWVVPPACPLVSGLPGPEGEFILERFTEIGRQVGAPLAGEQCQPNLYILVTLQPDELLHALEKRDYGSVFGYEFTEHPPIFTPGGIVDAFIATPRAVRVWYNLRLIPAEGFPSRVRMGIVRSFKTVFVFVDQRRLQGITRGQFADYLAMVCLAKLKPGLQLGDTPTILKLFDGAPTAAPGGLTAWDQAFLASLYTTDHASRVQRSQISHSMVHALVP